MGFATFIDGIGVFSFSAATIALLWTIIHRSRDVFHRDTIKEVPQLPPKRKLATKKSNVLEVCLSDIESVVGAKQGGADSIEICIYRELGGLTPSFGDTL
jgi:hypothetical protein